MGWWSSNSGAPAAPRPTDSQQQPLPSPPSTSSTPPTQTSPVESKTSPTQDNDFHAAFPHLTPEPTHSPSTTAPTPSSTFTDQYPTSMSCTAAFDSAFYCSSFGGHFNDIYRFGELRSCSEHWKDWRFCMGLSIYSKETQREKIRQHYMQKEESLKGKPNSEDVWERRTESDRILNPFAKAEEEARRVEKA